MVDKATTVPKMDQSGSGDSHDINITDILANSPIMKMVTGDEEEESQSEDLIEETDDSDEDLEDSDEDANEDEDNEEGEENADEDDENEDEDDSTQEGELSEADVDWDFEIPVKIDGEESTISLEELRKGYQTQKHLSNQGRELGEQRKALEKEQKEKLAEITGLADAMTETLMVDENKYGLEYNTIKDEIAQLRKDGDKFAIADKKDELEVAQEKYWEARKLREKTQEDIKGKQDEATKADWDDKVKDFSERIEDFVPNFDQETATAVRSFAIEQGIPEAIIDQVTSPEMVKFVNDYRLQMEKLNKGTAKRKKTVKRKVTPTKKNSTTNQKASRKKVNTSAKLAAGTLSESEGDDFIKNLASRHFN
jgi:hypothetical protein